MRVLLLMVTLAGLAIAPGCNISQEHLGERDDSILAGSKATASEAAAVLRFLPGGAASEVPGTPSNGSSCSASLIAPRLAVLAAQCIGNTPSALLGDLACSPRDATGAVFGRGGCGHLTATDANGIVLDAVDISDLYVTIPTPGVGGPSDIIHDDVAMAVLPRPHFPTARRSRRYHLCSTHHSMMASGKTGQPTPMGGAATELTSPTSRTAPR